MRVWWWAWLVLAMTGSRCHVQKTMMGRGAVGGCGTEERSCPIPRVPARTPATQLAFPKNSTLVDIDLFSQAQKALCERSPFDVSEDTSGSGLAPGVTTLPRSLASLLKQSDSRKRHKKSQPGADKKSSRASGRSKGSNIWAETEEYFRDLTSIDIDKLLQVSSFSSLYSRKCFSIPILGKEAGLNADCSENVSCGNSNGFLVKEEVKEQENEDEQLMETGSVGAETAHTETDINPEEEEKGNSDSQSLSSLEWLLGCKNKFYLASERPSKKRKLLGSDAGLEKVLIGCPYDGYSTLCHFCCTGDTGKDLNKLIFCSSCNVVVHQKCYGMQDYTDGSWLCSWCKEKKDSAADSDKPCILCPKKGGALKPVNKSVQNGGSVEFAHLFCCLWMPEVYIEDLIMNVEGIKETRRKLVCHICKVKHGTCVRCSHGSCRASFHPICAREARHRMEVWGKYGCENVELRAFCSKHSEIQDGISMPRNGDKIAGHMESPDTNCDKSGDSELQERGLSESNLNAGLRSECCDAQKLISTGMLERGNSEDDNPSACLNFILIMKKLIDRGKVNVKDVALEIGTSTDSLLAALADENLDADLRCKIVKWMRNHAYMDTSQKNLKVNIKSVVSSKAEIGAVDDSEALAVSESDASDPVAVKSVPPRRITKSNIRILKDNKALCLSEGTFNDTGVVMESVKVDQLISGDLDKSIRVSNAEATVKNLTEPHGFQEYLAKLSPKYEGNSAKPPNCSIFEGCQSEAASIPDLSVSVNADQGEPVCSVVNPEVLDTVKPEAVSRFYVHPNVHKKLVQMQIGASLENNICSSEGEMSRMEASSYASVCCNHQKQHSKCSDVVNLEQMVKARKMGVLELSPEDEVEGEIIYFQHRLLDNASARKQFTDNLTSNVVKSLPRDIDAARSQRWDAVLVNQYLCELREAKKQGRRERRHKEAQAVLAAATAAAASSSRISSFRKDALDDSAHQESLLKLNTSSGRVGLYSQPMPRAKETLSRMAVSRILSEKYSEYVQLASDFSKDHPRSCDICRRSETILNPILVCSSCKVAVHLDCYRGIKGSTGPWYCELCEHLLSRSSGAQADNLWEKSFFVAECGLCPGTTGAFRKSTDGQWIHAFCSEWVFESTFRRGQVNPVEGMETVSKGVDVCCICNRRHGVCIKCNYGHCQSTFHPYCARCAGLYMNVKTSGGKLQHKAYCEKHSLEQRAKAETQRHGVEELKNIKQIRVELERLRLLCERIVKREKIKRELVLCSQDIVALKRDYVVQSLLVQTPFFAPDVSSESATTSLKGHMDDYRSCGEAIQRSDDITVDSTVSVNPMVPVSMDTDQRTDDSSTSQNLFTRKSTERLPFSGKHVPHIPLASRNHVDVGGRRPKARKHSETFEKELIMTSDQASMRNQRLPKGFVYVPAEQINQDACSGERLEHDNMGR